MMRVWIPKTGKHAGRLRSDEAHSAETWMLDKRLEPDIQASVLAFIALSTERETQGRDAFGFQSNKRNWAALALWWLNWRALDATVRHRP